MQSITHYITKDTGSVALFDEETQELYSLRLFRGPRQTRLQVFVKRSAKNGDTIAEKRVTLPIKPRN